MKVIDLLNKIANGKEVPEKIKYNGRIYHIDDLEFFYVDDDRNALLVTIFNDYDDYDGLMEKIEILEEEKKIPENLGYQNNADGTFYLNHKKYNSEPIKILSKKINEVIDYLDYLKSKGE